MHFFLQGLFSVQLRGASKSTFYSDWNLATRQDVFSEVDFFTLATADIPFTFRFLTRNRVKGIPTSRIHSSAKIGQQEERVPRNRGVRAILNSSPQKNELKSADDRLKAKKGEKKSSFCERRGNKLWEKSKKVIFSSCFIGYKEEVEEEEEKDDCGNFCDDDYYYFYEQCLYSKNWYSKPTEGSKGHKCTHSSH